MQRVAPDLPVRGVADEQDHVAYRPGTSDRNAWRIEVSANRPSRRCLRTPLLASARIRRNVADASESTRWAISSADRAPGSKFVGDVQLGCHVEHLDSPTAEAQVDQRDISWRQALAQVLTCGVGRLYAADKPNGWSLETFVGHGISVCGSLFYRVVDQC